MAQLNRLPAWLFDLVVALLMVALAITVERATQGRLDNRDIALSVGVGGFLLLRLGALLANAGRTLGCMYAFAITWLLPCAVVLYFVANRNLVNIIRDSAPFFVLLGFLLIAIMGITFERIRRADERRFAATQTKSTG